MKRHPRAARFLSACFSVAGGPLSLESQEERREELRFGGRPVYWMKQQVVDLPVPATCSPGTPAAIVARELASSRAMAAVVTDSDGVPLGLTTPRVLSNRVATGKVALDAPAQSLMDEFPPLVPSGVEGEST